jgi:hypothetical protein
MSDSIHNNKDNNHNNNDVNSSSQEDSTSNNNSNPPSTSSSDLTENTATFYFQPGQSDQDMIHQISQFINSFSNIQQMGTTNNVIPPEQLAQVMENINHISSAQYNENNSQDSENVQMMFEIEFIMDPNGTAQEDTHPHFENCQQINEILGKPMFIKKDDELIETDCNICMDHFAFRQYKRTLPKCNHTFHKKCIDSWLKKNSSCPVCRQEYLPSQD